jgi:hypothetical protein
MGKKAAEALDISYEELAEYLHVNHSVYMKVDNNVYYLTDCNFEAWRAQDTSHRNHKGHYIDCSPLVSTLDEFMSLPLIHGKTIKEEFEHLTFYASLRDDKDI